MCDASLQRKFPLLLLFSTLIFFLSAPVAAERESNAPAHSVSIAGPPAKLSAFLEPASAAVGETVALTLAYTLPADCNLTEKPEIEGLAGLSVTDMQTNSGSIVLHFIVDSITNIPLGPFILTCQDGTGAGQKIAAERLTLKVKSNLDERTDRQQLKPIFDIIPASPGWLPWLLWGAFAVVIILVIIGLIMCFQRRADRKVWQAPSVPPHIRAQQSLETLNRGGLFEKGEVKAYYFRFSEILKRYLKELRGFPAAEFTVEEIAAHIHREIDRELVVILKHSDLVKFADYIPSPSRKDDDMKSALAYIATTAPRPEPATDTGTNKEGQR
ncbi:MAG TPA: hypothetical protein VJZ49_11375 [Syntrophales bacterium]|nr:hypothetical protein [Syntrophales bacterium]